MARKSLANTPVPPQRLNQARPRGPDPFQLISSATVTSDGTKVEVPMLVLYGEWLKAAGFPIGSAAYLKIDERGELILRRIGLGIPRQLTIHAMPA